MSSDNKKSKIVKVFGVFFIIALIGSNIYFIIDKFILNFNQDADPTIITNGFTLDNNEEIEFSNESGRRWNTGNRGKQ